MTRYLTLFALYLTLTVPTPWEYAAHPAASSDPGVEEYSVYAAVVAKMFAGNKVAFDSQSPVNLLVIKKRTAVHRNGDRLLANDLSGGEKSHVEHWLADVSKEAISDYREKNRQTYQLEDVFKLTIKHVLVESDELEQIWRERRWKEFREKYPESGGFISFSRVGFNSDMTEALVYFEHWCGRACGSGFYLMLNRREEGWKVTKLDRAWIS